MKAYRTKSKKLKGTNYQEVHKKARDFYDQIKKRSKRKPYVRSVYFKKEPSSAKATEDEKGEKETEEEIKKKTFRWLWFMNHGPKAFF